jgi:FkbM family methyltransferase
MLESDTNLRTIAHQHYQEGRLEQAEATWRQVVEHQPQQIEAWFWRGLIADQLQNWEKSVACYEQVLALQPNSAEAHGNLGAVLLKQGQLDNAIAHQQKALALMPDSPSAHYNLAVALYAAKRVTEAIDHYRDAIALNPDYANAHHNLGMALYQQGQVEDAIAHYQQAVALMPDHSNAWNSLGVALSRQGKLDDAVKYYRRAIAIDPTYVSAYDNLGIALKQQGNLEEAILQYQQAIALDPTVVNTYNNLGNALRDQGRLDEALSYCQEAIRLQPNYADAHNSYGCVLVDMGRLDAAIAAYEQAIRHKPNYADAHLNLGIILLMLGDFQRGFAEYHWRWQSNQCSPLRYPQALWDGAALDGKTILLTAEQGFGDTIQFSRYAPLVAQRGGRVVIACQQPLLRLLSSIPGVDHCIDRDQQDVDTHVHTPLMDLPLILGTTIDTIPATIPYLSAPEDCVIEIMAATDGSLKVGIVWATNPHSMTSSKRSCPLEKFISLLEIPGVTLYSLQKDATDADRAVMAGQDRLQDLSPQLSDFADTAAAIAQLDLIISVDTAVAHLAGALGKPIWTLLAWIPDWRWQRQRDDSPWYPTMRLFRQDQAGNWDSVFQHVADQLRSRTLSPRPPLRSSQPSLPHTDPLLSSNQFTRLKPCRHGTLLYNINDLAIGKSLELYGEWHEGEIALFQSLLQPGDTVVEVGAGIGAHTVFFAQAVGQSGKVFALEPQRILFQMLCGNLALNSLTNAYCYQIVLGETVGFISLPVPDWHQIHDSTQITSLGSSSQEQVQIALLDNFSVPQCRLLTVYSPSRELSMLKGAEQTIQRCQPILYIIHPDAAAIATLTTYLDGLGYDLYRHDSAFFNPNNFCQYPDSGLSIRSRNNLLAIPRSHGITVSGMEQIPA